MKKIGILSMQRIPNYGSFLQAYGLKMLITDKDYEVEFVDYVVEPCAEVINSGKKTSIFYRAAKKIYKLMHHTDRNIQLARSKNQQFVERYNKEFLPLLGVSEEKKYHTQVDTLVIGSDEVFNCLQTNTAVGFSKELFGYNNNAGKVITYAASFGNTTITRLKEYGKAEEVRSLLEDISTISVRDSNSGNVVKALLGNEPHYHLDPVLMYDFSGYVNEKCVKHDNYIIVYAYGGRIAPSEAKIIKEMAGKYGKRLISISGYQDFCDEHLILTPFEVLSYFKKADFIITDTFHGSIFSIINNRNFATIIRKTVGNSYGNEEKLSDLLTRLELSNRVVYSVADIENKYREKIDYTNTNAIIKKQRELTKQYLDANL